MTATFERLRAILIRDYKFAPDLLELEAPLEALGIDSLGTTDLLFNIEDEFAVTLPPEAVQLTTLGDVVDFIDDLIVTQSKSKVQTEPIADFATPAA
ncbi:MAG: acyl carrier protein [Saprospiraceae bacterium]|nr:acyl carrier protein [Saprospiraceae bacterium]